MMETYIEVAGEAPLMDEVAEHRLELTLTVRAATGETAAAEAGTLRDDCIRALREAGITDREMAEGGSESGHPWFWRQRPGQEVSYKILLGCPDAGRMFRAVEALQPLFGNPRFKLDVSARPPKFQVTPQAVAEARAAAIRNARDQATLLAREAGVSLGGVLQVEELAIRQGRSGMFGDEDWRGGYWAVAASAGAAAEPEPLNNATRQRELRYRVRFAIGSGGKPAED